MKIEMLNLGWMTAAAGLWRQGEEEPERPLRLPVPAYLIETESERILVDTGLHPDAVTDPEARYGEGTALGHFGLEQEEGLVEQVDLDPLGVRLHRWALVEDAHRVPGREERVDDVRPDESRAAEEGDEAAHALQPVFV